MIGESFLLSFPNPDAVQVVNRLNASFRRNAMTERAALETKNSVRVYGRCAGLVVDIVDSALEDFGGTYA